MKTEKHPLLERDYFEKLRTSLLGNLNTSEYLFISLFAEASHFARITFAKVRQSGIVHDAILELTLVLESNNGGLKRASSAISLRGIQEIDIAAAISALKALRSEAASLPEDPYAALPKNSGSTENVTTGALPAAETAIEELLKPAGALDLVGIFASGPIVRATANSAGQVHWFYTETFSFDYSIYANERAVKGSYAGKNWDSQAYAKELERSKQHLSFLLKPARKLKRGAYRAYLAPSAVAELITMFSWGTASEAALRQGNSPFRFLRSGDKHLSPLLGLSEDFSGGEVPRFNDNGEIAPLTLPIISEGRLINTLVNKRTEKEYGVPANGANEIETLRSPVIGEGTLLEHEILNMLETGIYISNLHYLNWSDQPNGRITGMTRYACFLVESGNIVAPIENLRFDDTIFDLFGSNLEALTKNRGFIPEVHTYFIRSLGGTMVPGILVSSMKFTL
ncbi:MAG: metallopeptidase TldD-related protein [Bdellovibrionota bacterium]